MVTVAVAVVVAVVVAALVAVVVAVVELKHLLTSDIGVLGY